MDLFNSTFDPIVESYVSSLNYAPKKRKKRKRILRKDREEAQSHLFQDVEKIRDEFVRFASAIWKYPVAKHLSDEILLMYDSIQEIHNLMLTNNPRIAPWIKEYQSGQTQHEKPDTPPHGQGS